MKRIDRDAWIRALVLVRIGQELGTDSPATRAIHDIGTLLIGIPWKIFG